MEKLLCLHRYYIWANRLRGYFESTLSSQKAGNSVRVEFADDTGLFLAQWYTSLYVVIEGWKELKLSDFEIDRLIASPNTELLRRFRNGVCHFQGQYFDARFSEVLNAEGLVAWVRELNREFGRYFLEELKQQVPNG